MPSLTAATTNTCPPYAAEQHLKRTEHGPAPRFFEKTALKIAARKLRKALQKQDWAAMQGDSAAPCGQILLRSGRVIDAELTDITSTEVKYRPCGQPDYPKFVLSKKDVLRVVGADGQEQYTDLKQAQKDAKLTSDTAAVNHKGAVASAVLSGSAMLVGLLFFQSWGLALLLALTAIVLGSISLKAIRKHPDKYKGNKWAIIGLILGGILALLAFTEGA